MKQARKVVILGGSRTPFVKSFTKYSRTTNQDLLVAVLKDLAAKFRLEGQRVGDVAAGAVIKHSSDWNLTRESVLGAGLHPDTGGYNVQRACGTSLETFNELALKIAFGQIDSAIAGGVDTNSDAPVVFPREMGWKLIDLKMAHSSGGKLKALSTLSLKDLKPVFPGVMEPRTGLSMGDHTELMVKEWKIPRADQDELALRSHKAAAAAYAAGFYADLVFPFKGVEKDGFVRGDTTIEKLASLKPAFDKSGAGTLTAGNSTPLTDGGAAVLLSTEEWASERGFEPQATFVDCESAAVDFVKGEGLLMAPTIAVSRLLKRNGLELQDFDFYEIHEAFAGQVLCTLRAWESEKYCKDRLGRNKAMGSIDLKKMNVKGGSLATGHPFAATGARIIATLAKTLKENGKGRGLISICTAGGMGIAAIIER
jgi:acetyl-CoA C-acetyltransferase